MAHSCPLARREKDVDRKVTEVLTAAGLSDAADRTKQYPHEFSGGIRQRALVAIGLACRHRCCGGIQLSCQAASASKGH